MKRDLTLFPGDKSAPKVLLVDDSEDDYVITRSWLKESNSQYQIEWAKSYDEGLEKIAGGDFDICLIDYSLGARSGLDWLNESRVQEAAIPVIMLTGIGSLHTDLEAMASGVADYLEKSRIDGPTLDRAIRYAIENRRLVEALNRQSRTDSLTNTANRLGFQQVLAASVAAARRHRRLMGLLCIDLDKFKEINDTLGHSVGDQVLCEVASRLQHAVRADDMVARLGGDEFAVLLNEISAPMDAARVAHKVLETLRVPIRHEGHELHVSASVGIAVSHGDEEASQVFDAADMAMYESKRGGRNQFCFFDSRMQEAVARRAGIESDLKSAIARDQLSLAFQPQVDAETGRVVAVEALIRWRHPHLGHLSPGEFIPVAENSQVICDLGQWVLAKACESLKLWHEVAPRLRMSVNISPRHLEDQWFLEGIRSVIDERGVAADALELEITETAVMQNPDEAVTRLLELNRYGVRFAIDDFGTGYSSLANLKKLPVRVLKIDRTFVSGIGIDKDDETIIRATLSMARSMGLEVVAEGVETKEQAAFLTEHGCTVHQGFYYSRPVSDMALRQQLLESAEAANCADAAVLDHPAAWQDASG
ncbi:MAG: EAL domain-containing protein [Pseudomonadota bacterium]